METSVRILKVFLNRWLDRAEADTNRTLRKLVEFGYYFSGSAPQKRFFAEAKNIISDKSCKYYILAQDLFSSVSKERAAEFGIAFGYYGLAKNCRFSSERLLGHDKSGLIAGIIPTQKSEAADDFHNQFKKLSQNGTGIYFIFIDELTISVSEISELIDKSPHKAFFIFTANEDTALKFAQKNVMPVLDLKNSSYGSISGQLKKRGRLFGGYFRYGNENACTVTSKNFLDKVYEKNCLFLFLIQDENCSETVCERISAFSHHEKLKPSHPIFITDILGDLERLNKSAP